MATLDRHQQGYAGIVIACGWFIGLTIALILRMIPW